MATANAAEELAACIAGVAYRSICECSFDTSCVFTPSWPAWHLCLGWLRVCLAHAAQRLKFTRGRWFVVVVGHFEHLSIISSVGQAGDMSGWSQDQIPCLFQGTMRLGVCLQSLPAVNPCRALVLQHVVSVFCCRGVLNNLRGSTPPHCWYTHVYGGCSCFGLGTARLTAVGPCEYECDHGVRLLLAKSRR